MESEESISSELVSASNPNSVDNDESGDSDENSYGM